MKKRINTHEYFMAIALLASLRSTCVRRKVGCVAVKDKHVIATGYNGAISGMDHCTQESCYRLKNNIPSGEMLDRCYAVHAEQNVICQAAIHGKSLKGATVYITTTPCLTCLKLLAQIGIKEIYCYDGDYPQLDLAKKICEQCNIILNTTYFKYYKINLEELFEKINYKNHKIC